MKFPIIWYGCIMSNNCYICCYWINYLMAICYFKIDLCKVRIYIFKLSSRETHINSARICCRCGCCSIENKIVNRIDWTGIYYNIVTRNRVFLSVIIGFIGMTYNFDSCTDRLDSYGTIFNNKCYTWEIWIDIGKLFC